MNAEEKFQKNVIREFRKNFFHVCDLSVIGNEPGIPDLLVSKSNVHNFFEIKAINSVKSATPFINKFTQAQPVFYKRYLDFNSKGLWVIAWSKKENEIFYSPINKMTLSYLLQNISIYEFFHLHTTFEKFFSKTIQYIFEFEKENEYNVG